MDELRGIDRCPIRREVAGKEGYSGFSIGRLQWRNYRTSQDPFVSSKVI
jgi:hypothetical protein